MPTIIKRFVWLALFLILFNLLWSYLWYLGDTSQNPAERVALPTLSQLSRSFIQHNKQLADVDWHVGIVTGGYEKLDSTTPDFNWSWQRNWAYFPLQPYLARSVTWLGATPFFALLITSLLGVIGLTLCCMGIVDQEQPFSDKAMRVALIMLAFVIPPLGFMTNFVVLASALYVATYLILRKILSDGGSVALIVGAAIILISCGLTRVQGTVFSLAIASAFAISAYSSKLHRAKPATIMALLSSALVPVAIIGCIFKVVANDPLAFQKIQIAWGRVLSMPWKPIIEGFQSGAAVNFGNGTEFPFTIVRIALFVALAVVALLYWAKEIYNRQNHRSLVIFDGFALLIGLGLIALPLMTSTLMSTHRYMTCSAIIVAAALKLGWRPSWLLISLLLLLRMGEFALFFRGYPFLVW